MLRTIAQILTLTIGVGAALALAALAVAPALLPPCTWEDGSGEQPPPCHWDASTRGDGIGHSVVILWNDGPVIRIP